MSALRLNADIGCGCQNSGPYECPSRTGHPVDRQTHVIRGPAAAEAYMLCSVCADLRISEIVDQPNWMVSLYFPKIVFD